MGNKRIMSETLGFLGRLRRDARGNMLAFMAALLVPLAALSGSAVDMGRMYAVKTRLQQACDAGVLAGRKTMTDSTGWDSNAQNAAQSFFKSNFQSGWMSTKSVSFNPQKTTENQVSGTATATVPMAVMGMFGMGDRTVNVSCEARYDVADADIVFVLDTTGSMSCLTSDSVFDVQQLRREQRGRQWRRHLFRHGKGQFAYRRSAQRRFKLLHDADIAGRCIDAFPIWLRSL